jgi:hypothetical protein
VLLDGIGEALLGLALPVSSDPLAEGPVPGEAGAAGVLGQQQTLASVRGQLVAECLLCDHFALITAKALAGTASR